MQKHQFLYPLLHSDMHAMALIHKFIAADRYQGIADWPTLFTNTVCYSEQAEVPVPLRGAVSIIIWRSAVGPFDQSRSPYVSYL